MVDRQTTVTRLRRSPRYFTPSRFDLTRPPRRRRSLYSRLCQLLFLAPYLVLTLILICSIFFPSYSRSPQRNTDLRRHVRQSAVAGAANPNNEKIFIAASLYDKEGGLLSGHWGKSVLSLIHILGPQNVFLSIYENDPDDLSKQALNEFGKSLTCNSSIVAEDLDFTQLKHVTMADGSLGLKRMTFLAEVRNRALRPLDDNSSKAYNTRYDRLLYLNDVAFDPVDAANLLFNTNVDDTTGKASYRAACAVDFINPFKFYDTFATRDLEGYEIGVPFFPWFTGSGNATGRRDVLAETDAVRVKSCWGGMVAFEARWFQQHLYDSGNLDSSVEQSQGWYLEPPTSESTLMVDEHLAASSALPPTSIQPLRFRAEPDTYWDASECCLIHADLSHTIGASDENIGIYLNPYVRVAYSRAVLAWLPFSKRFERLYPFFHNLVNVLAQRPGYNVRRLEQPGDEVIDRVWTWDDDSREALRNGTTVELAGGLRGSFREVRRTAQPGQFCGSRRLLYIKERPGKGESPWGSAKVPIVN